MADSEESVEKGRVSGVPVAAWRRLYDVATRLRALDPWQWMTLGHLFGVQTHDAREPSFVLFTQLAESKRRMVAVFSGWQAFRVSFANNAATDSRTPLERAIEESWLRLLYVARDELTRSDRAVLARLGLLSDTVDEFPVFYSQRVGYYPDRLGTDEVEKLQAVLYQAYGVALRVEMNQGLTQERLPQTFFVRLQDADGRWRDAWVDEPRHVFPSFEVQLERDRLRRVAELAQDDTVLQINIVLTPLRARSRDSHRSEAIFTLLLMERKSREIICCEALQALQGIEPMWAQVPGLVLRELERRDRLPAEIEVCSERMFNVLRPLSEELPFKLRRRAKLATLDLVFASLTSLRRQRD